MSIFTDAKIIKKALSILFVIIVIILIWKFKLPESYVDDMNLTEILLLILVLATVEHILIGSWLYDFGDPYGPYVNGHPLKSFLAGLSSLGIIFCLGILFVSTLTPFFPITSTELALTIFTLVYTSVLSYIHYQRYKKHNQKEAELKKDFKILK